VFELKFEQNISSLMPIRAIRDAKNYTSGFR